MQSLIINWGQHDDLNKDNASQYVNITYYPLRFY